MNVSANSNIERSGNTAEGGKEVPWPPPSTWWTQMRREELDPPMEMWLGFERKRNRGNWKQRERWRLKIEEVKGGNGEY